MRSLCTSMIISLFRHLRRRWRVRDKKVGPSQFTDKMAGNRAHLHQAAAVSNRRAGCQSVVNSLWLTKKGCHLRFSIPNSCINAGRT